MTIWSNSQQDSTLGSRASISDFPQLLPIFLSDSLRLVGICWSQLPPPVASRSLAVPIAVLLRFWPSLPWPPSAQRPRWPQQRAPCRWQRDSPAAAMAANPSRMWNWWGHIPMWLITLLTRAECSFTYTFHKQVAVWAYFSQFFMKLTMWTLGMVENWKPR